MHFCVDWPGFWFVMLYSVVAPACWLIATVPELMWLPELVVVAVKAAKLPSAISPTSTHSTAMVRSTFRRLVFLVLVIWALPSSLVGSPVAARRLPRPWGLPVDRLPGRRLERLGAVPGRSAPGDRGRGVHGSPRRPLAVPGLRRYQDADG